MSFLWSVIFAGGVAFAIKTLVSAPNSTQPQLQPQPSLFSPHSGRLVAERDRYFCSVISLTVRMPLLMKAPASGPDPTCNPDS